jgi:hypothetical protein
MCLRLFANIKNIFRIYTKEYIWEGERCQWFGGVKHWCLSICVCVQWGAKFDCYSFTQELGIISMKVLGMFLNIISSCSWFQKSTQHFVLLSNSCLYLKIRLLALKEKSGVISSVYFELELLWFPSKSIDSVHGASPIFRNTNFNYVPCTLKKHSQITGRK